MARQTGLVAAPTTTVVADQTLYGGTPQVNVQGFDVVDALPAAAADKLRALRQRADDLHMLVPEFDQVNELSIERIKADRDLKRLLASAQDGGFRLLDSDSRVKIAQKRLDKLTDDLARLRNLKETRTATWQVASRVLGNVEGWLKTGKPGNTSLVLFEEPEPKLAKGETLLDAIESRRRRVRELRADLARIEASPYPSAYCKQRMCEQIEQLAQRSVNVSALVEHDGRIEFPMTQVRATIHNATPGAVAYHEAVDVVGLIAFLHKPALIAALDRLIDEQSDDPASLSHEARQQRTAEVMGDLLSVERDEAALVWRAMDERLPVEHRPDNVNPIALVGLVLVATPHATSSAETSPQWAATYVGP